MSTAISTSNIQHREEQAMSTSTTTEVKPGLVFREEESPNKRLKVSRMAQQFNKMEGVRNASVGTLSIAGEPNQLIGRELVEVRYDLMACEIVGSFSPFTVVRAYYDREEQLVAAVFRTNPYDGYDYHIHLDYRPILLGCAEVIVAGETYDRYSVHKAIREALGDIGDQYGRAVAKGNAKREEQQRKERHEAAIAAAYAEREDGNTWRDYRAVRPLYKAQEAGITITTVEELDAHRHDNKDALKVLRKQWYTELFGYCQVALGKLRTEVVFLNDGEDPYGFVTPAEVSNYILTRWVREGWGNEERAIRAIIAQEFVSDNF